MQRSRSAGRSASDRDGPEEIFLVAGRRLVSTVGPANLQQKSRVAGKHRPARLKSTLCPTNAVIKSIQLAVIVKYVWIMVGVVAPSSPSGRSTRLAMEQILLIPDWLRSCR